jgi:soluble lytic murein transglycosylase
VLLVALVAALAALGAGWYALHQAMPGWYARLWYPLEHEEEIRAHADRQGLDPALVAAIIQTESGFVPDSRSAQGAVGLMQVLPETARFVAGLPDRPSPPPDRLERPDVNIAYGTRYLRYLLDRHGSLPAALAAYNAGESNLVRWREGAEGRGETFRVDDHVPYAETRRYVRDVLELRPVYRRAYPGRLSISSIR